MTLSDELTAQAQILDARLSASDLRWSGFASAVLHTAALLALLVWSVTHTPQDIHLQAVPLTVIALSPNLPAPSVAKKQLPTPSTVATTGPRQSTALPTPAKAQGTTTSSDVAAKAFVETSAQNAMFAPAAPQSASVAPKSVSSSSTGASATTPIAANTTPSQPTVQAVELPSSNAAYLNNPPPQYPPQSRRLGEQGTVKWRVLVGIDGKASQPELVQGSGFTRLDEAAKQAVLAWRYLPGNRGGVTQAMFVIIPITFSNIQP
jgi:periplasmic protein TonB